MKTFRNSLLALGILVLLGALVWLTQTIRERKNLRSQQNLVVFPLQPEMILTLHLLDQSPFTLQREKAPSDKAPYGEWVFADALAEKVDPQAIQMYLKMLTGLKATRFIEKDTEKIELFGLDQPTFQVTADGEKISQTLWIGARLPIGREVFAKRTDLQGIFVIAQDQVDLLRREKEWFVNRHVLPLDPREVTGLEAKTFGSTWSLTLKGDQWHLRAGKHQRILDRELVDTFLSHFAKLRALKTVKLTEAPEQLESVGLGKPMAQWIIHSANQEDLELRIGSKEIPTKEVPIQYVTVQGRRFMFGIPVKNFAFLEPFQQNPETWFLKETK